jgi:hypothetical protein
MATGFILAASLAGLAGLLWTAQSIRSIVRQDAVPGGTGSVAIALLVPIATTLVVFLFLFRIGTGLKRLAPGSRWVALSLLVLACIPLLVTFFEAVRNRDDVAGGWLTGLLLVPAAGSLFLASSGLDPLFGTKSRAVLATSIKDGTLAGPSSATHIKFVIAILAAAAILALVLFSG